MVVTIEKKRIRGIKKIRNLEKYLKNKAVNGNSLVEEVRLNEVKENQYINLIYQLNAICKFRKLF